MSEFFALLSANSITRVVLFPAVACLPLLLFATGNRQAVRLYTLVVSLVQLGLTVALAARGFSDGTFATLRDLGSDGEPLSWIPRFGVRFELVLDGISMPLVLLTSALLPLVVLGSWHSIERHWRGFAASLLLLTTGILGAFVAFDLFVFYIFWELMLIPMYLLIGIWGGKRRVYAAVKFFLYTMVGSLLMLVGIVWLAWTWRQLSGQWSFSYEDLLGLSLPLSNQLWVFGAFALAFAIKVPLFPFHTWLPDAHVEAPTGGSVVLAGVLLKLGTYGFLRFAIPLFPHATEIARPLLVSLAVIGILYGALVAWVQTDFKKLVAYSSVAHLGFVVLGLLALDLLAWQGALIQMVNHGLSTGALFLLVGMLYDRRHTRAFEDFGGLAKVMPWFAFFLVFSALASVGLPGLNGFVGEFLILVGAYRADLVWPVILATFGVVLAAVYLLKMLHETLWGPLEGEENRQLTDLGAREILLMTPLCVLMLLIGVAPRFFLEPSRPALEELLGSYRARVETPAPARAAIRAAQPAGEAGDSGTETR